VSLDTKAIVNAVVSHAVACGHFQRVQGHEPKNAPGNGLSVAVWLRSLGPAPSGLRSTCARLTVSVRCVTNMLAEPQDGIDPNLTNAVDALLTSFSGDFTFGGLVRSVDLLGATGEPLSVEYGYLDQDNKKYRAAVINLPLIVNDVWSQSP
jgi:hypothetical protein